MPSHILETSSHKRPIRLVQDLALRKAREVAGRLHEGIVLGADTVVVLHGKILGKPRNAKDAGRMLGRLSGTTHRVYTGVALVDAARGESVVSYARSDVRMKKIAKEDHRRLSGRHLDKAGSYAIQEKKDPLARVVKGSYDNVVGLPLSTVRALLKKLSRAV